MDDLLESIRAGAIGYVPGALDAERLRRVVNAIAAHEAVVPRSMVLELLLELRGGGHGTDALTSREAQVLGMLRRGQTTAEIADRLAIAPVTVRRHISQLVRKLGVENRAALDARRSAGTQRVATRPTQRLASRPIRGVHDHVNAAGHSAHCSALPRHAHHFPIRFRP